MSNANFLIMRLNTIIKILLIIILSIVIFMMFYAIVSVQ